MLLAIAVTSHASNARKTEIIETEATASAEAARVWGLSDQEWRKYQQVMSDQRGIWSPGLDPITALGVSADTAAERKRYAELYVRTEFERTRKELAFQLAVDNAWARLYPETPRIGTRAAAKVALQGASRYALIVSPDCGECTELLEQRIDSMMTEATEGVDVHVVGTGNDDEVLRRWVAAQPALIAALKSGRATVNHGNQFRDLSQFPAIYSKTGSGQWVREL
jgi:integrating conjugative element protein (TIGR03759 family)